MPYVFNPFTGSLDNAPSTKKGDSAYTTVNENSATNWNYQGTDLKDLSANWVGGNDAYTNLVSNSAAYLSDVDLSFLSVSGNWNSVYSTVNANSAITWSYQGSDLKALSSNWENTYTTVQENSASWAIDSTMDMGVRSLTSSWESTYTTVNENSATWDYQGSDIKSLTAGWVGGNDAYTNLVSNSAAYLSAVDLSFLSVSGNWNSTYTTVQENSATWDYRGSDIKSLTAGWVGGNDAYTNLVSNSAAYLSGADLSFLSVSGNWNSTYTTVYSNSSYWETTYTTIQSNSGTWNQAVSGIAQTVVARVHNSEAVTLPRGSVVYTYGATGDVMSVRFASNSAEYLSSKTVGIVNDPIAVGGIGYITIAGQVDKLNLGAFSEGDSLYLGSALGSFTNVKPVAPQHLVYLGVVERANNGNGLIYVKVQNGYEIEELHNVLVTSVSANQIIRRNGANNLWVNTDDGDKWDSTYTTVNSNSANWNLANLNAANFLPLSGGTMTGKLFATASTTTSAGFNIGVGSAPNFPVAGDLWLTSGGSAQIQTSSLTRSFAFQNAVNNFNGDQRISASSTNPALDITNTGPGVGLRVKHTGSGFALRVEDDTTPDETSFIVDGLGNVGIGLSNAAEISANKMTVVGNVSATGNIFGLNLETSKWNSAYSTVQSNSASNWNYQGTDLKDLSANWQSTYTTVQTKSATEWDNALITQILNNSYLPLSGGTLTGKLNLTNPVGTIASLNIGQTTGIDPTSLSAGDIWIRPSGDLRYRYGSGVGSTAIVATVNGVNTFSSPQTISTSNISDALRITQIGTGNALVVEDSTNPDATPFIVDALGSVGIGLSSLSGIDVKLTVVGNISSTAVLYTSAGNSDQWSSVYNTVQTNSATNWSYQGTDLKNLSANWESTYNSVSSLSGSWLTPSYLSSNTITISALTVTTTISAKDQIYFDNHRAIKTPTTNFSGISAVTKIVAVSALPTIQDSGTLYILI